MHEVSVLITETNIRRHTSHQQVIKSGCRLAYFSFCFHILSRTCRAGKGLTKSKMRRSTGREPGTKSAYRPLVKPRMNRLSTGRCVHPSFYIEFCLPVLSERCSRDIYSISWGRTVLSASLPGPASPTTGPTAIFDAIFGSEDRSWGVFFDIRTRRAKMR